MAKKREIAVGYNIKKVNSKDFDYQEFDRLIEEAYLRRNRGVSHKRKRSFAPSSIGYGSGTCFAGETEFVTDEGIRTMADAVGEEVVVWTGHGRWGQGRDKSWSTARGWKPATVQSFGTQPLMKVTLSRDGVIKEIFATAEHRWIAETAKFPTVANRATPKRLTTSELEPGHRLWRDSRVPYRGEISRDGIRAGSHPESKRWTVVSVEQTDRVEEVFCVVEPETERFALADGILTMNCPRRWYLAFSGAEYDETADALGVANMAHGVAVHDRLQELFEEAGIVIENERELSTIDPPIRAFIDSIVEVDGIQAIVEIKSTREESFVHRRFSGNPMPYHLYQLLIYMYFEEIPQGCLLYENKNDNTFLTIPIRMNDYTRTVVEDCLEWLRLVRANWEQDATWGEPEPHDPEKSSSQQDDGFKEASYEHLPTRPFTKRSKECKSCPVFNECWNLREEGTVDIKPMEVVKL